MEYKKYFINSIKVKEGLTKKQTKKEKYKTQLQNVTSKYSHGNNYINYK